MRHAPLAYRHPHLLKRLEVSGCIVTIAARGCQQALAKTITAQGAAHVLAVKRKQSQRHQDVKDTFHTSSGMVAAERGADDTDATAIETRWYRSRLAGDAAALLAATRGHWVLDLSFREDERRVRIGNATEHLAVIRHLALNLLKQEPTSNASIRAKRKRAGGDHDYLLAVHIRSGSVPAAVWISIFDS